MERFGLRCSAELKLDAGTIGWLYADIPHTVVVAVHCARETVGLVAIVHRPKETADCIGAAWLCLKPFALEGNIVEAIAT